MNNATPPQFDRSEDSTNSDQLKQLVSGWGDFLAQFHWNLYATPSFKYPVSFPQAKRAIDEWLQAISPDAFAYIAFEKGQAGGRTHAHLLVGGLFQSARRKSGLDHSEISIRRAARLWRSGNIDIERFDPLRGACWYVSKFPNDGEIVGQLKRHRARRRRNRSTN